MSIQLDYHIYQWLLSLKVFTAHQKFKLNRSGKYELDATTSKKFETGQKFAEILTAFLLLQNDQQSDKSLLKSLNNLKNTDTSATRVYNWNILSQGFSRIGIIVDDDIRKLLQSGDIEIMQEFLQEIYEQTLHSLEGIVQNSTVKQVNANKSQQIDQIQPSPRQLKDKSNNNSLPNIVQTEENAGNDTSRSEEKSQLIDRSSQMFPPIQNSRFMKVNLENNLSFDNLLNYLVKTLSMALALKVKQTAALFANGNKYLAHVIVKGIKGKFGPLVEWLEMLYKNFGTILQGFQSNPQEILIFFSVVKPCLLSKSEEVAQLGCKLFTQTFRELPRMNMQQLAWNWFCQENGGLSACLLGLQRHSNLGEHVADVFVEIGQNKLGELLTIEIKKIIENPKDYIHVMKKLFVPLSKDPAIKQAVKIIIINNL